MAQSSVVQPCPPNRSSSFFKLITTFASEIGELKQEMVQKAMPLDRDPDMVVLRGLEGEVSRVYLQPAPCLRTAGARDSGYDSLRRRMSVLDRLVQTHPVWLLLSLPDEEAARILLRQPPGMFLVRKSSKLQKKVISLRLEESSGTPVSDFPIKESQYTFALEGSGVSFSDLFRLVAFYCISRDVLPFPLRLPEAIAAAKTPTDLVEVAQLGAGFWDSGLCNWSEVSETPFGVSLVESVPRPQRRQNWDRRTASLPTLRTRAPSQLECGQSNGALCFINPLFLKPRRPASQRKMPEKVSWIRYPQELHGSAPSPKPPKKSSAPIPVPAVRVVPDALEDRVIKKALSRVARRTRGPAHGSLSPSSASSPRRDVPLRRRGESGQRLSDLSMSTSSSDSLDFSPSVLLQGVSPTRADSSVEEEEEEEYEEEEEAEVAEGGGEEFGGSMESDQEVCMTPPSKPKKRHSPGNFVLPRALRGQIRKMSGVFSSLMTPEKRALHRVRELSEDKASDSGCLVQGYISFLQENHGCHTSGTDLLQTLRQFITQMKAYLCQSSELDPPIASLIPEEQIDRVLEKALHKCVLKPLKGVVESALREFEVSSGAWKQLKDNLALAKTKQPQELGVDGGVPPDPMAIEKIRHKIHTMCKMYSPEKKVNCLLRVCKMIYTIMEDNSGRMYGADDFLPMLTYVLAQCDMPQLDIEIQYMMELLDPSLLHGEGGYYLTSAYGAMSLIKNFQEEQAAGVLSSETRNTLRQWHRRRTAQRSTPSIDDFQNFLRVALQRHDNGCTAKTLPVRPHCTTEEVCALCADRFGVRDPENHALFLFIGETSQQLAPDTYPQKIKAEIHSRPQVQPFHFVYKRVPGLPVPADQLNGNHPSN
ncbi:hypothetical protein MATL_G00191220 [Megalops atlanticus]|uniref:Ras and Rab interactor 2 n=1 Tax=Megalops atlanticus TaxID=7932 RepID=A0A9D3T5W8_MEGAT|nr:hypothetical protein MATL_G00191220 [Megalops atlanticus]